MSLEDTQARAPRAHDGWIGRRPTAGQIAAFLTVGSVALIMAGVQPVVLGGWSMRAGSTSTSLAGA